MIQAVHLYQHLMVNNVFFCIKKKLGGLKIPSSLHSTFCVTIFLTVLTTTNGVQYRIMNAQGPGVQYIPGGYQLVTSASGQVRPIILAAQNASGTAQPQRAVQTVMLRNISPKTSISTTPSSTVVQQTRPSSANS